MAIVSLDATILMDIEAIFIALELSIAVATAGIPSPFYSDTDGPTTFIYFSL